MVIFHIPSCRSKPLKASFVLRTQNAFTLLYQPQHRDASSSIYALIWMQTAHPCGPADTEECMHFVSIISKMALHWLSRYFFVLFPYKKYSRHFIALWLNHWWQMEYSGDAFHTFLDLDSVIYLAVNGTVTSLPVYIQNILICVLKTN